MAKTVSIGAQDFCELREKDCFYVDKTYFIKEWWESEDVVTLITRPRRFGKTITMSMLNCFFSMRFDGRSDLFEGLDIYRDEKYKALQGTYPVIFLTFAGVKGRTYEESVVGIKKQIVKVFSVYSYLREYDGFDDNEKTALKKISEEMSDVDAEYSLNLLSTLLEKYHGKKVIVLLDEYDTPLQEAYVNEYWDDMTAFIRSMFNNTFKTNPSMERAIMTGITRVSKESIFSDLNNLEVVTTTSEKYETAFGFTEEEVFAAIDSQGMPETDKEKVKFWYDGFTFGKVTDIYNPWSVTSYLDKRKFATYWANTSGNGLVGKLIREGDRETKLAFEKLLKGECIETEIDEQIIFDQLKKDRNAIWSLLLASGYLKVDRIIQEVPEDTAVYHLKLTNFEVKKMFEKMIHNWFTGDYAMDGFLSAMLLGDTKVMNRYMNRVALNTFSYFDTGKNPSGETEPERFYHGFVLGLMVDKSKDYIVKSNRESGYGRYDVVMEPKDISNVAVVMEFKVYDAEDGEETLADTAENALKQIEEKKYDADLLALGIPAERIYKFGFAFRGKECLIKKG